MVGLPNNSNVSTLRQWYQLFANQGASRSADAYAHWRNVERLGLPTHQHEHWKYTPLNELLAHRFVPATFYAVSTDVRDALSLTMEAYRLVFVNGRFMPTLSDSDIGIWQIKVEEGATRRTLAAPIQSEVFLHLTESLSQEITNIRLPIDKVAHIPLYLLHISDGNEDDDILNMQHYRHHIDIESGAHGQIIEHFTSVDASGHFSGSRTTFTIGDNAQLCHIKLASESRTSYHFSHNDISVGRDAVVHSSTFILGAGLTRHQTSAQLNGEGSNLTINSLLLPSKHDISDSRTYLEHNKGHCLSRQLHKVIAIDCGRGVFNGMIKVAKNAQKTDSQIINNNLLLNCLAEVDTKPQLEIYADDVKCSHGVTIGQINDKQIFYLRSRGITYAAARQMIIYAFVSEIIAKIDHEEIRDLVLARITDVLQRVAV